MSPNTWVLDASAILRLFLEGPHRAEIMRIVRSHGEFHSPAWTLLEIANALKTAVSMKTKLITTEEAETIFSDVCRLEFVRHEADTDLIKEALDLAIRCGLTVYDAVYVVLAQQLSAVVLTADAKLIVAAARHGLPVYKF